MNQVKPSRYDLFISPHSDDICFSLGALAFRRHMGVLLGIFPISNYVAAAGSQTQRSAETVTRTRMGEDAIFASRCGLTRQYLNLPDAPMRGRPPFDTRNAEQAADRLAPVLVQAVLAPVEAEALQARPLLFCPSGIGRHLDHVAVRQAVVRNLDRLSSFYDVCFYEDLPYASYPRVREEGLSDLSRALDGRKLIRHEFPLDDAVAQKLELIRLYRSQFADLPSSLHEFTPAVRPDAAAHEACWVL